jgi:S1-C subfamily serine protease
LAACVGIVSSGWATGTQAVGQQADKIAAEETLTVDQMNLVKDLEQQRVAAINQVIGSVVAIYDDDRKGGGSGVIFDPSGLALTNHHVIMGAGVTGWGGLADGKLYRWRLIGTDPGGDVAIIQLEGKDAFPFTPLGDSDNVAVGDWALAMGNPFILTEDQSPTVTLGIVSGVKRYQPGAGGNQLVYGNCIQVDSSINPGNSGGPLFNLNGQVIGINGRGSFKDRGRVNVGLGYAISANQIKNFIPELLATKLVQHATLDVTFEERGGKVVCSRRNVDSPVAKAGLGLGDELISFEGVQIQTANQFTNLICTLPQGWPIKMRIRRSDGTENTLITRALGLPYAKPRRPRAKPNQNPAEERAYQRQLELLKILKSKSGAIREREVNRRYAKQLQGRVAEGLLKERQEKTAASDFLIKGVVDDGDGRSGGFVLQVAEDGRYRLQWRQADLEQDFVFDGKDVLLTKGNELQTKLTGDQALEPQLLFARSIAAVVQGDPLASWRTPLIDGADRAAGEVTYRLRFDGGGGENWYAWVTREPTPRLVKVAPDRDCEYGGIMMSNWEPRSGRFLPSKVRWVRGLADDVDFDIKLDSVEATEIDEAVFNVGRED